MAALGVAIVAFAAGLRLYMLGHESAWNDEVITLAFLDDPDFPSFMDNVEQSSANIPPVYPFIEYYWAKLFGTDVYTVRLLSVLFSASTAAVLFFGVRRYVSTRAAAISALMFAVAPVQIYYGQEVRMYALATLLAVLSFSTFARIVEGATRWAWASHVACNALMVFTHPFTVFLLPVQALTLCLLRPWPRRITVTWIAANGLIFTSLGLWAVSVDMTQSDSQTLWIHEPSVWETGDGQSIEGALSFGLIDIYSFADHQLPRVSRSAQLVVLRAVFALLLVCSFALYWKSRHGRSGFRSSVAPPWLIPHLLLWLLLPTLVVYLISHVWRPCLAARYLLYSSIPIYILAGIVAAAPLWPLVRRAAVVIVAAIVVVHLAYGSQRPLRIDWSEMAERITASTSSTARVVVYPYNKWLTAEYHLPQDDVHVKPTKSSFQLYEEVLPIVEDEIVTWVVIARDSTGLIEHKFRQFVAAEPLELERSVFRGWRRIVLYRVRLSRDLSNVE